MTIGIFTITRVALLSLSVVAFAASAATHFSFTGSNYGGVYDCTGNDTHEGPYTGTVTLQLVREQSTGKYGAYRFLLEVPGYGAYPGHAAARDNTMAIYFALTDASTKDYGTGIARFSKAKSGKWQFRKYYYEPEFKGGNHGMETCVQR